MESLRKDAGKWTLDSDDRLLRGLESFSEYIQQRSREVEDDIATLCEESRSAKLHLANAFNRFLMLQNNQFIENRVSTVPTKAAGSDEMKTTESDRKTSESGIPQSGSSKTTDIDANAIIEGYRVALAAGMKAMDFTLSESAMQQSMMAALTGAAPASDSGNSIVCEKDEFNTRPLPALIGSKEWRSDENLGMYGAFDDGVFFGIEPEQQLKSTEEAHSADLSWLGSLMAEAALGRIDFARSDSAHKLTADELKLILGEECTDECAASVLQYYSDTNVGGEFVYLGQLVAMLQRCLLSDGTPQGTTVEEAAGESGGLMADGDGGRSSAAAASSAGGSRSNLLASIRSFNQGTDSTGVPLDQNKSAPDGGLVVKVAASNEDGSEEDGNSEDDAAAVAAAAADPSTAAISQTGAAKQGRKKSGSLAKSKKKEYTQKKTGMFGLLSDTESDDEDGGGGLFGSATTKGLKRYGFSDSDEDDPLDELPVGLIGPGSQAASQVAQIAQSKQKQQESSLKTVSEDASAEEVSSKPTQKKKKKKEKRGFLSSDDSEDEDIVAVQPKAKPKAEVSTKKKKPTSTVMSGLFSSDDEDEEDFTVSKKTAKVETKPAAASSSSMTTNSSSDNDSAEVSASSKKSQKQKIFKPTALSAALAGSNPGKKNLRSILDSDSDDDFLSAAIPTVKKAQPAAKVVPKASEPKKSAPVKKADSKSGGGLFDSDSDDDLFAAKPSSKPAKKIEPIKPEPSKASATVSTANPLMDTPEIKPEPSPSKSKAEATKSTGIGAKFAHLNINPATMKPGVTYLSHKKEEEDQHHGTEDPLSSNERSDIPAAQTAVASALVSVDPAPTKTVSKSGLFDDDDSEDDPFGVSSLKKKTEEEPQNESEDKPLPKEKEDLPPPYSDVAEKKAESGIAAKFAHLNINPAAMKPGVTYLSHKKEEQKSEQINKEETQSDSPLKKNEESKKKKTSSKSALFGDSDDDDDDFLAGSSKKKKDELSDIPDTMHSHDPTMSMTATELEYAMNEADKNAETAEVAAAMTTKEKALFGDSDSDDDLFASSKKKKTEQEPLRSTTMAPSVKPTEETEQIASVKKSPSKRKTRAGLFGESDEDGDDEDESSTGAMLRKAQEVTANVSKAEDESNEEKKESQKEPVTSGIAARLAGLNIDPTKLKPGAAPPKKEVKSSSSDLIDVSASMTKVSSKSVSKSKRRKRSRRGSSSVVSDVVTAQEGSGFGAGLMTSSTMADSNGSSESKNGTTAVKPSEDINDETEATKEGARKEDPPSSPTKSSKPNGIAARMAGLAIDPTLLRPGAAKPAKLAQKKTSSNIDSNATMERPTVSKRRKRTRKKVASVMGDIDEDNESNAAYKAGPLPSIVQDSEKEDVLNEEKDSEWVSVPKPVAVEAEAEPEPEKPQSEEPPSKVVSSPKKMDDSTLFGSDSDEDLFVSAPPPPSSSVGSGKKKTEAASSSATMSTSASKKGLFDSDSDDDFLITASQKQKAKKKSRKLSEDLFA